MKTLSYAISVVVIILASHVAHAQAEYRGTLGGFSGVTPASSPSSSVVTAPIVPVGDSTVVVRPTVPVGSPPSVVTRPIVTVNDPAVVTRPVVTVGNQPTAAQPMGPNSTATTPNSTDSATRSDTTSRFTDENATADRIDRYTQMAVWGVTTVRSFEQLSASFDALANTDQICATADRQFTFPASCAERGAGCGACFVRARHALDSNRRNLNRAYCVANTHLTMARSAIAFGDSASGIHGASGLGWQLAGKPQIEEAMNGLRSTYSKKYNSFMRAIESNLQTLGRCEEQYFKEDDWYQRYGFMYLEHLELRYQNPDR